MKKVIILLLIIGILISPINILKVEIPLAAPSSNYYVANGGDDSNNGTSPSFPWKTIGKVNSELNGGIINQGDDIYFNRGNTFGDARLQIYQGGTSDNYMVIGAYGTGANPIFNYNSAEGIRLYEGSIGYIKIENIHFYNIGAYSIRMIDYSDVSNIIISHCTMEESYGGIYLAQIDGYLVENCIIHDNDKGMAIYGSQSSKITNGAVRNCTFYNLGMDIGWDSDGVSIHQEDAHQYSFGPNHIIENCTGWNCGEQTYDLSGTASTCHDVYYKNCTAYNNGWGSFAMGGTTNVTIDNCFFYYENNTAPSPYNNKGWHITDVGSSENLLVRDSVFFDFRRGSLAIDPSGGSITDIAVYNNDFIYYSATNYDSNQANLRIWSGVSDLDVRNNIFYSLDSQPNPDYLFSSGAGAPSAFNGNFSHNIWWMQDETGNWWNYGGSSRSWATWHGLAETQGELRNDPEIANIKGLDFSLNDTSPCIDAGEWLTTTNGGGSGTVITVHEANYFSPGIATEYYTVQGDKIFVGSNTNLRITSVDYDSETITVNRSITWSNGDDVSLSSYSGTAPDIGAKELFTNGPDSNPPKITNITLSTSDPLDTEKSFGWINITANITGSSDIHTVMINISCPNGTSFYIPMNNIGSNNYYYNSTTIFTTHGDFNYYIWANDTNGNQSTSRVYDFSMPPNWDINNDRQCTILDLTLISNHYGEIGSPGWIREDFDNNGIIQMLDLVLVSEYYNNTW